MKYLRKRIISVCSALVLIIVSVFTTYPSYVVFATQNRTYNFNNNYTLTGDGATDILRIAFAQVGRKGSDFGYTENWCADFVSDCADLAGQSRAIPRSGAVSHEYTNSEPWNGLKQTILNAGGTVVTVPQAGDIVIWKHSGASHVEIVSKNDNGKIYSIGGNNGTGSVSNTTVYGEQQVTQRGSLGLPDYYIRPAYAGTSVLDPIEPKIEISGENYPSNPHTLGNNFGIEGIITSNNKLDRVWGGVYNADGTKAQYYDYNPNSWTVDLHGVFNNNIIFDNLSNGSYTYKIEARDITGYSKVLFTPYSFTVGEIKPGNVKLSIPKTEYMKGDNIVFTPSGTNVTGGYTIGIDDASGNRLITQTFAVGETYSTSSLAAGNYSAYVTAYNGSGFTDSARIYFSVGITAAFNVNGGNCGTASKRVVTGDKYGSLPNATRSGYIFVGWYTEALGGTRVTDDAVVTSGSNHTLYAHWEADNYIVVFNSSGGSGSMSDQTIKRDETTTLAANAFSSKGYTFAGWNTKADGTGTSYADKASVKNLAAGGTITLYAQWTANKYTVKFNGNGADELSTASKEVTYNSTYGELPNSIRAGYNFIGWYTQPEGGVAITPDTKVAITDTQTLYAQWSQVKFLITFNANGGTSEMRQKLVSSDNKYGVLPSAEKIGYEFGGWYLDEAFTKRITEDTIVKITKNQEVYAKWVQKKYTVTFEVNGGTVDMKTKKVVAGKVYGVLPEAEKNGFEFAGWFTESGKEITSDSIVELTADTVLYAKWRLRGDVDADGDVDVADVVLLQRWLLAGSTTTLNDWQAGDLCENGRIDVFDLCLIKQLLIERIGD